MFDYVVIGKGMMGTAVAVTSAKVPIVSPSSARMSQQILPRMLAYLAAIMTVGALRDGWMAALSGRDWLGAYLDTSPAIITAESSPKFK